jgi:halimadienyl-diphosphate synthase
VRNVDDLLAGLLTQPDGQLSPSVYETGRLVALAPWLPGHRDRWKFLMDAQHLDGSWGGPDEYGLVPTLSATDAALTAVARDMPDPVTRSLLRRSSDAGLRWLLRRLGSDDPIELPDTVAVELIVPPLVDRLNEHLATADVVRWRGRLYVPRNLDQAPVAAIRARIRAGGTVPTKLAQSLEIAGPAVSGAGSVTAYHGAVGCAPAATAAWLADDRFRARHPESVEYLTDLIARHGGPVPTVIPITRFERAWVLADLVRSGMPLTVPPELLDEH